MKNGSIITSSNVQEPWPHPWPRQRIVEGRGHSGSTLCGLALPETFVVGRTTASYLVSDVISCQDGLAFPLYQFFSGDRSV